MNKLKKCLPFAKAALFLVLVAVIEWYHAGAWKYDDNGLAADQFSLIEQSKEKQDAKSLIIGDSVAAQLFGNDKKIRKAYTITGNCSATLAGYYILMRNYVENNPQTERIWLVISPDLIANAADTDLTYQYYVVPYYTDENMEYITPNVQSYIDNKFGVVSTRVEPVKKILYNDIFMLSHYRNYIEATRSDERQEMRISWLTAEYLKQMKKLCDSNNIKLRVVAPPLQDNRRMRTWKGFEEDVEYYGLKDVLKGYKKNANYYHEDNFKDEYHFEDHVLRKKRPILLKEMFKEYL